MSAASCRKNTGILPARPPEMGFRLPTRGTLGILPRMEIRLDNVLRYAVNIVGVDLCVTPEGEIERLITNSKAIKRSKLSASYVVELENAGSPKSPHLSPLPKEEGEKNSPLFLKVYYKVHTKERAAIRARVRWKYLHTQSSERLALGALTEFQRDALRASNAILEAKAHSLLASYGIPVPAAVCAVMPQTKGAYDSALILDFIEGEPLSVPVAKKAAGYENTLREVISIAAKMHSSGIFHQDLYLHHIRASGGDLSKLVLTDLGRVTLAKGLKAQRLRIKDVAALIFSMTLCDVEHDFMKELIDEYSKLSPSKIPRIILQAAAKFKAGRVLARYKKTVQNTGHGIENPNKR
ncbi:MAG: lipopolysaccharide kinase InaA family protein [Planctomycetes bacterium]|nr:lipopolysaccharide kinase InaA family protein [Planctomycetota bacterium]